MTKYGRHGEYVLHVGVDEEVRSFSLFSSEPADLAQLFPNKPPPHVSNKQREKMKAQASAVSRQATGSAGAFMKDTQKIADKGKNEANKLDAKKQEQQRRESRAEGWRSEAFDV